MSPSVPSFSPTNLLISDNIISLNRIPRSPHVHTRPEWRRSNEYFWERLPSIWAGSRARPRSCAAVFLNSAGRCFCMHFRILMMKKSREGVRKGRTQFLWIEGPKLLFHALASFLMKFPANGTAECSGGDVLLNVIFTAIHSLLGRRGNGEKSVTLKECGCRKCLALRRNLWVCSFRYFSSL